MSTRTAIALVATLLPLSPSWAAETVRYRLDLDIAWSAETHPLDFFPAAHLSPLIGATHNGAYVLFGDDRTASSGLQSVAERGKNLVLRAELDDAMDRERVGAIFEGGDLNPVPGVISASFTPTEEHIRVSFVTMVAPSPDWFTDAAGVELFRDGVWVDQIEVTLWAWDAGTDNGATWTAENAETQPPGTVCLLTAPYFFDNDGLRPIGSATLVRME